MEENELQSELEEILEHELPNDDVLRKLKLILKHYKESPLYALCLAYSLNNQYKNSGRFM